MKSTNVLNERRTEMSPSGILTANAVSAQDTISKMSSESSPKPEPTKDISSWMSELRQSISSVSINFVLSFSETSRRLCNVCIFIGISRKIVSIFFQNV